jgi:hypothetical protein
MIHVLRQYLLNSSSSSVQVLNMAGRKTASRNITLPGGVSRYSRSAIYAKKALYKLKKVQRNPHLFN